MRAVSRPPLLFLGLDVSPRLVSLRPAPTTAAAVKVVNGLQAVQWQLLGYESKPDGQPDHERPLYSMSNPNPVVNSIVRRYATDTMANLHVRRYRR